jgi:hypothetical protein
MTRMNANSKEDLGLKNLSLHSRRRPKAPHSRHSLTLILIYINKSKRDGSFHHILDAACAKAYARKY